MSRERVNDLVSEWFRGDYLMFDACIDEPEAVWLAILEISGRELTDEQKSLLAGGALETLLARHGPAFIERVEAEATNNPEFNYLLGGIWRQDMSEEIWSRVEKARKEAW